MFYLVYNTPDYIEGRFTDWARCVLGSRFEREFFRQYSYPSVIAHGKPHGVIDVLEPIGPGQVKHYWDSRTIDELSELSKLAAVLIECIAFVRRLYGLDISDVFKLNKEHAHRAVVVLMLLFCGYLAWRILVVDHRGYMSALPPILAGVIALSLIFGWFTSKSTTSKSTKR